MPTAGLTTAYNANAQTITIGGVNVTLDARDLDKDGAVVADSGDNLASEVAAKMVTQLDLDATYDAAGTAAAGAAVTVKWAAAGDKANIALVAGTSGVTIGAVTETTKGVTAAAAGTLELTKMADNGTLELNAAGAGVKVTMTDATGSTDTLNLVLTNAATTAFGTVEAAGVETINITSTDSDTTVSAVHTATLKDAALKTVTIVGNAGLTLSLDAVNVAVTTINGAGMTGALTVQANGTVATTITGGSAADTLKASAAGATSAADVLIGGAGNDKLYINDKMNTLTGGAGNDEFYIQTASINVNSYATITDASAGDRLFFNNTAGTEAFKSGAVTLGDTAVFQDYANAAVNLLAQGEIGWFQYGGNTYVIQEASNSTAFVNGTDYIVKLTGLVDLSTASYSATDIAIKICA